MEPVPQEVDGTSPFVSNHAPPLSGIRAVPSRDDSDGENFLLGDSVPPNKIKNEGFSSSSSSSSSNSGDSDKEVEEEGGYVGGEKGFGEEILAKAMVGDESNKIFGEPMSEFSTPRGPVPRARISAFEEDDGENELVVGEEEDEGLGSGGSPYVVKDVAPKVRTLRDEDLEVEGEEDGYQTAMAGPRNDKGVKFDDLVSETGKALEDVEEGEEESSISESKSVMEESKSEGLQWSNQVGSMVDEPTAVKSQVVEDNGVKFTGEGDAIVDSINLNATEAVRSGAAVVGEAEEGKDSETKEVENSAVEEPAVVGEVGEVLETKEAKASGDDEKSASENAEAVMADDLNVGAGVFREVEGVEDLEATLAKNVVPEKPDSENLDIGEADGTKFTGQRDSVVDKINVDVAEAIRSGAIVVGEHVETKGLKPQENGSAVDEDISTGAESSKHENNAVADQAEILGSVDNLATENIVAEPESKFEGLKIKALEQREGNVDVVSGRDSEKVEEVYATDDTSERNDGPDKTHLYELANEGKASRSEIRAEAKDDDKLEMDEDNVEGSTDGETDGMIFGSSAAARQFMQELERASGADSQAAAGSSHEHSEQIDGQIVTDSEEADSDNEQDGKELFDSAALAALLKAATNASVDPGNLTITSQDGTRLFSVERPAGLGPSLRPVRSSARPNNSSMFTSGATAVSEESLSEEERKKLEKLQQLRVKFLRLVYRLGHSPEDSVAAQVLYRLALVAGRPSVPSFSLEVAKETALKREEEGADDLNLSLNILVLGKSGVGKSATINSIFGEEKVKINAFEPGTMTVNEIGGIVSGVNIRVFDTPGLKSSALEQGFNRKVLASVKKFMKKSPPDIVLYVDRLDSQTKDLNDLPLLRTITSTLGSSIWRNTIVTLTHAACAPPDGPSGSPLSYEVFVAQRSHIVQQYIGQAVGDFRLMSPGLMNPVSLVENHLACRRNREGQKVLPNGQTWRPQLMLLCFSMKILSEASSLSKAQDSVDHRKLFGFRVRSPPLPYLLSSLLQPRAHPKLSADQGGDNADSDIELDDLSDLEREEEEEDEYDQLPPFKPLRKAQLAKLSKEQRRAYFEEYDYRVKLLQKKQWKAELKRMRDMKNKGATNVDDYGQRPEDIDQEDGAPAAVPVPLPDMVLPPTFDGDNPAYRYRFLEPTSQFLARPVLDTHGWDHDCGYDGVNIEQNLGIAGRFPAALTVQVTKDKKDFNLHLDSSVSAKHGEHGSSLVGFDIQNIGKQMGYIVRGETKFKNLKKNKTAAGVSVTFLGENVATGVKVEDQISLGKRLVFVGSTGTVRSQKDAAYGANLEVRLRDADYPIGQDQSSFVLSLMKWRGDLAVGANLQSQISIGRNSKMALRVALNNKLSGQITVRTSSSDHLQLALAGLIPIAVSIFRSVRPGVSENYSIY